MYRPWLVLFIGGVLLRTWHRFGMDFGMDCSDFCCMRWHTDTYANPHSNTDPNTNTNAYSNANTYPICV